VVFEEEEEESAEEGSVHVFQAEEEEEEDKSADVFLLQVDDDDETTSICASKEEEESKAEGKNDKTGQDTHTAEGGTMSTLQLSRGNRGPSRTVLDGSKESSSLVDDNNTTSSDLDKLSSSGTKEVEGLHDGNAPDDRAAQHPTSHAADLLQDHTGLQRAHRELTQKARTGCLDPVLGARIMAMKMLLNLYLDKNLGYTWMKALSVVTKSEGRGTTRVWLI
jgi:hypothetical protein